MPGNSGSNHVELNRNHYFVLGMLLLLIGIQLRFIDSYVLNEPATRFLAAKFGSTPQEQTVRLPLLSQGPMPRKVISPPEWLGWSLMSIGSVLMLHSLAMKKPG